MSEYKRLTNNNADEYDPEYDFCIGCKYFGEPNGCNRQGGSCSNYERFIETYNRLAELEDKIENGTLVHLPCKVFDDVYLIHNGVIEKCIVEGIHYTKKSSYVRLRPYHQDYLGNWSKYFRPSIHSFLKTIFPTREEAEKALDKQRKEDKNNG